MFGGDPHSAPLPVILTGRVGVEQPNIQQYTQGLCTCKHACAIYRATPEHLYNRGEAAVMMLPR